MGIQALLHCIADLFTKRLGRYLGAQGEIGRRQLGGLPVKTGEIPLDMQDIGGGHAAAHQDSLPLQPVQV